MGSGPLTHALQPNVIVAPDSRELIRPVATGVNDHSCWWKVPWVIGLENRDDVPAGR